MSSKTYWKEREARHIEEMLSQHINYEKEIHKRYKALWDAINDEIQKFYSTYAGKERISISEAKKRVSKHDVQKFAEQAKRYVKTRDFSKEANEQLRLYNLTMKVNRLELLKAKIGLHLTDTTDQLQKFFKDNLTNEAIKELERQAGILGGSVRGSDYYRRLATSIVNGSFRSATFSQRLWVNQDILKANIDRLLTVGITAGKHPNVLARELRRLVVIDALRGKETADYVARRLMISESSRIQSEIQKKSYEKYGFESYNLVPEPTTCSICKGIASDGPYKVSDMQTGENASPIHNWCRCSCVPAIEE